MKTVAKELFCLAKNHNAELSFAVQDIANKVSINNDFSIYHPSYEIFDVPELVRTRLNQLPDASRKKSLSQFLCNFIYGAYYNSSLVAITSNSTIKNSMNLIKEKDAENKSYLDVDVDFYDSLHASNTGTGYYDHGWLIIKQVSHDNFSVKKNGLTLLVNSHKHIKAEEKLSTIGDFISILMPKNLVQNGFYMAVGNEGVSRHNLAGENSQTVRIYFNVSSDDSTLLMRHITEELNKLSVEFTYKTLYDSGDYGRYDSGVLYIQKSAYEVVHPILQQISHIFSSTFGTAVPLFTKKIGSGIGLAEEPVHHFSDRESFGSHRCRVVADGFLESWNSSLDSPQYRVEKILKNFALLRIDIDKPYLNPDSEDIYNSI